MGNDDFDTRKLEEGKLASVGGVWHGEGDCDHTVPVIKQAERAMQTGRRILAAVRATQEFDDAMREISKTLGTPKERIDAFRRQITDMAINQEVLAIYRRNRIMAGRTDHKTLLKRERFPRAIERIVRLNNRSGIELGWFFGLNISWKWPFVRPEGRPYNWEIDGIPGRSTPR